MRHRQQYRSISRELVLLSLCQINDNPKLEKKSVKEEKLERQEELEREREKLLKKQLKKLLSLYEIEQNNPQQLHKEQLNILVATAIASLRAEIEDSLETASKEIFDSSDRITNSSENKANAERKAKTMLEKAKELAEKLTEKEPDKKSLETAKKIKEKFQETAQKLLSEGQNDRDALELARELISIEQQNAKDTRELLRKLNERESISDARELASVLINAKTIVEYFLDLSQRAEAAKTTIAAAIESSQNAINLLGYALELQEFVQLANQYEVREYALELLNIVVERDKEIRETIERALVGYSLDRLARVDRQILKIAVAEIIYIEDIPEKVAINEAVELAKRYSGEETFSEKDKKEEESKGGYRFINGVLRRVSDRLKAEAKN